MVEVGDRGVVTINPFSNQFIPASTPDVGDRVIVIPMNDGSKFCIPCLEFNIGDWLWVGPEFKWNFDWAFGKKTAIILPKYTELWDDSLAGVCLFGTLSHATAETMRIGRSTDVDNWNIVHSETNLVGYQQWVAGIAIRKTIGLATVSPFSGVLRSTDSGASWSWIAARLGYYDPEYGGLLFISDSIVLMGGRNNSPDTHGKIWRSIDAGLTWSLVYETDNNGPLFYKFAYLGSGICLAAAMWSNKIYRSVDYGITWAPVYTTGSGSYGCTDVIYLERGSGICLAGSNQYIYRSLDYGANWSSVGSSGTTDQTWSLVYCGGGICLASIGYTTEIVKISIDYGATWNTVAGTHPNNIQDMEYIGDGKILAVTFGSSVYKTTDYGSSWSLVYTPPNPHVIKHIISSRYLNL